MNDAKTGSDFPNRIGYDEALAMIAAVAARRRLPVETVPLARAAGRVLAEDVVAGVALPPFDNAAMDGFALRAADAERARTQGLRLVGDQFAGADLALQVAAGECARITTGAPMPAGADAVLIRENARVDGERVFATEAGGLRPGRHLRRAGEDVQAGDRVLVAGTRLGPAQLGLAAAVGRHDLPLYRRPTVAVFTTGDELCPPGQPLAPGRIYDSNRALLQTLLQAEGLEPVAWPVLPDRPGPMLAALRDAAFSFDVVITCGGVSAGDRDHLPALLREHGEIHFWRVRMKPGMPLLFAGLGEALLLGLPGNPVSVLATFLGPGRALLDGLQGLATPRRRLFARLATPFAKAHARLEFLRGRLESGADAVVQVRPDPADGSHRLRGAADADCLLVLGEGARDYAAGDVVEVVPLRGF
ncbi:molybdopterin molybdotransferase MoeA [Arenimonas composti]|uniref:Molybdopterin molybdenumtransferase n=1 Tax=Arenimonas composti TR7-09 = DSM 18010 TaxID=1121013 RepID=A0A091AZF1_9GAMM|nr:gephyrin-like molybdotransferase Glp [Arenimonas composti]KFN45708.1 hypothetical protein P873_02155 [Arenimonas composti TR7-09 = DSM 18010]